MAGNPWTAEEVAMGKKAWEIGGKHAAARATGRSLFAVRGAADRYGWSNRGLRYEWSTREVSMIQPGANVMDVAAATGRSPISVRDKAKRLGVKMAPLPKANEWPQATIGRAKRMRENGSSIREIQVSTGAPFNTVRNWIYGY